jgi:hypothetical protein
MMMCHISPLAAVPKVFLGIFSLRATRVGPPQQDLFDNRLFAIIVPLVVGRFLDWG